MRVHHLNCGLMCPPGGRLFDGVSRGLTARLTCHCLLIETDQGLVLVDTGFGLRDVRQGPGRVSPLFLYLDNIQLDEDLTALRHIQGLGCAASDVRHIVMTHLDFDHAGGIADFPEALVHVMDVELEAASRRDGLIAAQRYARGQIEDVRHWATYHPHGERWFGFEAVQRLRELPPEILFVSLPGHTAGHAGVAVRTPEGWLLHAGDAYFHRHEMDRPERHCPAGARAYQRLMAVDHGLHLHNQGRLRELYQDAGRPFTLFCTHDPVEFEALALLPAEARSRRAAPPQQPAARTHA